MGLKVFLKHQLGALVSTTVDFVVMTSLVEMRLASPEAATACGAGLGALTNFVLGRHLIFAAQAGHMGPQALRYALVSGISLGLNTGGEALLHRVGGMQYFAARVIVSAIVSVGWSFPMHRRFVFPSPVGSR